MPDSDFIPQSPRASRRGVLGASLGLAAASQSPGLAFQGPVSGNNPLLRDELVMLLHHGSQGITIPELNRMRIMGRDAWLDEQLDPDSIDDSACDAMLQSIPFLGMTGQELWDNYTSPSSGLGQLTRGLQGAALIRSTVSKRQLFERMVEFWSDHFSVYQNKTGKQRIFKVLGDRDVIRAHALGNFRDILLASARSASMSLYLDNYASSADAINENYSRELLELHTVGVDAPFGASDIVDLARCLTGWRFEWPGSGIFGTFRFASGQHDNDSKTVMGLSIPAGGGESDGVAAIDYLASHPLTAQFVSRKMISWLLRGDPDQAMVNQIANVFMSSNGDIKAMVRAILDPDFMLAANPWRNPKLKRPFHLLVGLMRQLGVSTTETLGMNQALEALGHAPYDWHAPDGYSDRMVDWGGAVLSRWKLVSVLLENQIPGVTVDSAMINSLFAGVPKDRVAGALDLLLCGGHMSLRDRGLLQDHVDSLPNWGLQEAREAIALAASTPSHQAY